jgi:TolB-like protein/Tfp pilus assembly protein PilF
VLVEFASAVNAVQCAVDLQQGMATANADESDHRHINIRIGVNLGDVMVEGGDLYGDGVNIAVRLEAIAEPGGIIVSGTAYDHLKHKLKVGFDDLGAQALKNITEPVRAYRVVGTPVVSAAAPKPITDRPSIAVLPFENMSGDPAQEYFADGVVEEIITALSRFQWLFVIARNSSFIYKGRVVDVRRVGRELGVRYVLEGSVRKAGTRVRITGQLVDAAAGMHLWADHFDGALEDIFNLQDQVTAGVVSAIAPKLELAEIERSRHKPTNSLDAYDYYMRGMAEFNKWAIDGNIAALQNFYRAIELDPNYATAYGMAARCFAQRKVNQGSMLEAVDVAEAERLARRAADLGRNDATALCTAGLTLGFVVGDARSGMALTERALAINPNLAWAWYSGSWLKIWLAQPEAAIEHAGRAMQLSPQDPLMFQMQSAMAQAHFTAGRYDEALNWAERALHDRPQHYPALVAAAASAALLGRQSVAESYKDRVLLLAPALRLHDFPALFRYLFPEDLAKWQQALREAGLPE